MWGYILFYRFSLAARVPVGFFLLAAACGFENNYYNKVYT
jgi:hypothetical protein